MPRKNRIDALGAFHQAKREIPRANALELLYLSEMSRHLMIHIVTIDAMGCQKDIAEKINAFALLLPPHSTH